MAKRLEIEIVGDSRSYERALGRAQSSGSKFGKFAKVGLAGALTAVGAAAVGMGALLKVGFDEFTEAQKVTAQTNAVLKSTGRIANVTGSDVEGLANHLSSLSGVDDEVIRSGENLLLTFTNIRNNIKKNEFIFNDATKAALNMSVAMGTDMKQASILVGKALNDPVRGLTALKRVGVTFSKGQEEMIKKMVEAGDVAGAQKVILKELQKEFGGSAKAAGDTLGGQLNKLRNRFDEFAAKVFEAVLPALNQLLGVALKLFPLLEKFGGQAITAISNAFGSLSGRADSLGISLRDTLGGAWKWIQRNIIPIILELRDIWVAGVTKIAETLKKNEPELRRIWQRVGAAIRLLAAVALPILRFVFVEVVPRVIGITLKAMDKFTAVIAAVVRFVRGAFASTVPVFRAVQTAAVRAFGFMAAAVRSIISPIRIAINVIRTLWTWLSRVAGRVWNISVRINLPDAGPSGLDLLRRAVGSNAMGTSNWRGGLTMVGERGPELVNLPRGSQVIPNHRLRGGGSGVPGGLVMILTTREIATFLQNANKDYMRQNGGRPILGTS